MCAYAYMCVYTFVCVYAYICVYAYVCAFVYVCTHARTQVDLSKGPRDKVLCRVACAGLNPVDAKGLVGDKLPAWMSGASRQAIEGCGVGFDFSGTVIRAPPLSKLKEGDAIFGTAPPMVGTLSEEILVPLDQIATGTLPTSSQVAAIAACAQARLARIAEAP